MTQTAHPDSILIIDFGSQVTQLIARRIRESGVYCEIHPFQSAAAAFDKMQPKGVIFSGGPASVTTEGSPRAPQAVFDARFETVRRFDGLVWVEPEPATPFVRLTEAVVARWPEWPPYGGLFDEVIPHLTVVESDTAPLGEVETAVRLSLPFKARATRLELWRQDAAGRWHPHWLFPLGGDP